MAMHSAEPVLPIAAAYQDKRAAILEAKTYPLLWMLDHSAAAHRDTGLKQLANRQSAAMETALQCKTAACTTAALHLSEEEIAAAGNALVALYAKNVAFRAEVDRVLKSGTYGLHAASADVLREAWKEEAAGVNRTIAIYGEAAAPAYPKIDAMEFDPAGKEFRGLVRAVTLVVRDESEPTDLFFKASLRFALSLLRINDREDAAKFEPMEKGLNAAAIARIKSIAWSKYPYSAILVPGIGPEVIGQPISPLGQLHVALAAARYRAGKAPFLIVSGGSVHPAHTHFVEAEEMRRELMDRYGIPASAIFIEPHARHTTTNLRNAVREIVRYSMPVTKPVLIVCNEGQAGMIANRRFVDRNIKELGYLPWLTLKRLGPTELEFTPNKESLRVDSLSPLDP
ncbi:MAG: YdcF family protein [Acidobacteria bacterium]|nr:YdcF family protein [Acidobacteriota bacterium]